MTALPSAPRVLGLFGSLGNGAPQAERFVRVANGFGGRLRHFVFAEDDDYSALAGIEKGVPIERLEAFPSLAGLPTPGRLQKIARAFIDYHLILSWGWRAVDAPLAHTMFSQVYALPPLIHHEDGSDESSRDRRRARSKWYRRVGLGKSSGVVVPSELIEGVALVEWQQPIGRVKTIRDGVTLDQRRLHRKGDGLGRLIKHGGELWLGCVVGHGESGQVAPLLEALEASDPAWHLIVLGNEAGRDGIEALAAGTPVEHRIHFHPQRSDLAKALPLFDAFAVVAGNDPVPVSVIEAMAAGLAVCGSDPGEVAATVSDESAAFIAAVGASADTSALVTRLLGDDYLRRQAGAANRERARSRHDAKAMISAYRRLYASSMGRDTL